jgi:hypothetical protein
MIEDGVRGLAFVDACTTSNATKSRMPVEAIAPRPAVGFG